jgi:hypothetical protein
VAERSVAEEAAEGRPDEGDHHEAKYLSEAAPAPLEDRVVTDL